MMSLDLDALDFAKGGGMVSVVVQDAVSGTVLMTAFADREAIERTIETGEMHFRSRSRGLWHKGATSGNTQRVVSLEADCDGDAFSRASCQPDPRVTPVPCRAFPKRASESMPSQSSTRRLPLVSDAYGRCRRRWREELQLHPASRDRPESSTQKAR